MDQVKALTKHQLTEKEVILYLLVESGMSYRDIETRLMIDHKQVSRIYQKAKAKIDKNAEAGFYSTPIK